MTDNQEKEVKESKYTIGEYSFDTFHEYRDGLEDVKKIEVINKQLNIQDPEVAVRLYNDIREGKIAFKSPIGDEFYTHLADIVADKSVDLLEDKATVEEAEDKMKYQKYIGLAFMIVAVVSFAVFGIAEVRDIITTRQAAKMAEQVQQEQAQKVQENAGKRDEAAQQNSTELQDEQGVSQVKSLDILPEYVELHNQNPDMVGWLKVEGTDIDYVVVQKPKDNEFYLNHAFDGSENANGSIFMDYRSDIVTPTTNTIIYGHNMKSGMMFGGLKKYLSPGYLDEHKYINLNTLYEYKQYEIVAVCLAQVQYQDDANSYRYYDFISAGTNEEFEMFKQNVNSLAVVGSADGLAYNDKLLTLSTCNSYTEDGRLFVVAKQIK
ncbi:MAG: class B sortase [Lachnospiraceae bacterium]|nr:class B sortase [Lachnospiraceae bacterium]